MPIFKSKRRESGRGGGVVVEVKQEEVDPRKVGLGTDRYAGKVLFCELWRKSQMTEQSKVTK
ncbi:hypothetical protein [Bartonella acomydis]|uniref:Uncharacterized protein n=1 Tax=Bartonella acomydis TaxID=686234 RepID=A0ABP9MU70_9HYPH